MKSGIAAAINSLPDGIKGNRGAVAETIANNVRSRMSTLLDEIIADLRAKRIDYEEYLKRIAVLAKRVQDGQADDMPEPLKQSPGLRALYNNLKLAPALGETMVHENAVGYESSGDATLDRAMKLHSAIKRSRPDAWRGVQARELTIKQAMFNILEDANEVERLFLVVKRVHPPSGRVRISAPRHMKTDTIRVFAIAKLGWIRQQQRKIRAQERDTPREYSPRVGSIRLNTELAKKPTECLEYIVVHELVHLIEPTHNQRFVALMDEFMPRWRVVRERLNLLPVRHEDWGY